MAFGRRYGFVGRNGMGKTTLLRAISRRELYIPSHVSVLHVEQEVRGDDTIAVDSVLEADVVRYSVIENLNIEMVKFASFKNKQSSITFYSSYRYQTWIQVVKKIEMNINKLKWIEITTLRLDHFLNLFLMWRWKNWFNLSIYQLILNKVFILSDNSTDLC